MTVQASGTTTSADVEMSGGNLLGRWSRTLAENRI